MSNIESDIRTGLRGWMEAHPFAWGVIAFVAGILVTIGAHAAL